MINKGKDTDPDELEDDFEDESFADADLGEEYEDELLAGEGESEEAFGEEDFEGGEWHEGEAPAADPQKAVKARKSVDRGDRKGLSFNTIVIVGAVLVGGVVMFMTIHKQSEKQAAGNSGIFRSILGMAGLMDGTILGDAPPAAVTVPPGQISPQTTSGARRLFEQSGQS